ncbi:MAG: peptidyl-prolyl cis-trans isomerase [Polyangiaceae bacterium]|nr:peptidyl-prolyl cis-trans isomerase [Polyangiaceae bacterium]
MRRFVAAMLAAAAVLGTESERASAQADDPVVVTVGSLTLRASEVARRLGAVPAYQLRTYGATPDEVRRKFVEQVLVPELLHAAEAERLGLAQEPALYDKIRDALRAALETNVREHTAKAQPITPEDVRVYYEQNRDRFSTPRRLRLSRLLVADRALAERLLAQVSAPGGVAKWAELVREHSLDKATSLREGNLGFVRPDGQTDVPQVRVEVSLFEAALAVKDGELVKEPVKEGDRWALVWRRGSLEAVNRTVEQEERPIRQLLTRKRLDDAMTGLADRLRAEHVKDVNESLLELVDVSTMGDVATRRKPGVVPRRAASPAPSAGERGLR